MGLVLLKSLGFPLYSVLVFRHADQVNYQISLVEFLQSTQLINLKTSIEARLRPMRSYGLCGGASQAWDRLGAWQLSGNRLSTIVNFISPISTHFMVYQTRSRIAPTCVPHETGAARMMSEISSVMSTARLRQATLQLDHRRRAAGDQSSLENTVSLRPLREACPPGIFLPLRMF